MPAARAVFLIASLTATCAFAQGQVLVFPAIGTPQQLKVSGRVFGAALNRGSNAISRNLRSLLAPSSEGSAVTVRYAGQSREAVSGRDGAFEVTFVAPRGAAFPVGLSQVEATVRGHSTGIGGVDIVSPDAPFFVISDFDDTLAVTQVTRRRELLKHALAEDGDSQPLVQGMPQLMRCLREGKQNRPAFALVSGSPVQFVPHTAQFLFKHDFPPFGLYLRELGPGTLSDYKQPIIRSLLEAVTLPVVLIGDSGERDPEIYAQIRREFPGRVKAIAIHDVGRLEDAARVEQMLVFKHPREVMPSLVEQGFVSRGCYEAAFQ